LRGTLPAAPGMLDEDECCGCHVEVKEL